MSALAVLALVSLAFPVEAAALASETLRVRGAAIQVDFAEGRFDISRRLLLDRITRAACGVSIYYGRFPVPHYRLLIVPVAGRHGVLTGTTWAFGGPHSRILIGEHATITELNDDWIITHEMIHTAFPGVGREHHWIEEGIATYVEPLARSWVGDYPPEKVWSDLVSGLPNGMPAAGDRGLDFSPTWGRTYWGGAMFCLLGDVEIRRRTNCRRGLVDALRGILAASGGIQADWPLARALKVGDDAVGVPVLEELHAQMGSAPLRPDLAALWQRLGVATQSNGLPNDSAPEAAIRRAISARPADAPKNCAS